MGETTAGLVATYYAILEGGTATFDPERLRGLLADDLAFEGPIAGSVTGADRFVAGVSGFAGSHGGLTMLDRVHDNDAAASLYDAAMPGGVVRFAEFFRVVDGRIAGLRLLYDGPDYLAKGGR